jgi:UDP-glucose 4-epimerase
VHDQSIADGAGANVMHIVIAGGAGFIGSHMVQHLMATTDTTITIYDNFSSGKTWHLKPHLESPRLTLVRGDLKDREAITAATRGADRVYHYASNPDIAKAIAQPDVDFWDGTYLTQNLLEAMRVNGAKELVYASGSGVYGDVGDLAVTEDHSPMLPISPYGASKLACEAMIHAYSHMFGIKARVFRFANVVGGRQTHGVAYDFIRRLRENPGELHILGDGNQSKSYIHVDDIIRGKQYFAARDTEPYTYYQLATDDYLTVREIADLVVEAMGLARVHYVFSGGDRGWRGDVPVVRFDLSKVHNAGWSAERSAREAMRASISAMLLQQDEV